jgi:metal-responsive CopG/Arc/MetJ family transcriptional regulator
MTDSKFVAFREDNRLLRIIDRLANAEGISRSDLIRRSIRKELERAVKETKKNSGT